ncbi:hypothetical protein [Acinetobacter oleivorans]|uniref:hypothetical protein n=1 Tax=Acinetobacter oleivorans TaxID=1148157 RepID=UPI0020C69981
MPNPQNQQFWSKIAERPTEIQQQFWYGAEKLAKYLNDNPTMYKGYMTYDTSKPDANLSWWEKILFYNGQAHYNEAVTNYNTSKVLVDQGSWLWGMLKGDFNKDPSMSQIIVGGLISLIPIADQVCDVRDVIANLITLSDEKDRTKDNYMALALTSVGIIPEVGSAIKTVVKSSRAKDVSKVKLFKVMEYFEEALTKLKVKCPWGKAPEAWLRSRPWKGIATQGLNALKNNINRILLVINQCLKKFNGALQAALAKFQATLNHVLNTIKKYIDQLCDEVDKAIGHLLPQQQLAMAHAGGGGKNVPTGRYEVNVNSGKKTEKKHQQKATEPEKEKPKKDKILDDPCLLRPYKPDTCKPLGKTGHHVVPDRCFRLGSRAGDKRNPISGALSEAEGLVICLEGATPTPTNEHGRVHAQYSIYEKALKGIHMPEATAPLVEVEIAGAKAVSKVLKKCSAEKLAMQLRTYHQSKNLGAKYRVRVDVSGKTARNLPTKVFGSPTKNSDRDF